MKEDAVYIKRELFKKEEDYLLNCVCRSIYNACLQISLGLVCQDTWPWDSEGTFFVLRVKLPPVTTSLTSQG